MKCINMNIVVILFFISVKSLIVAGNKTRLTNKEVSSNTLDIKDCPELFNMIRNNSLSSYTINCSPISAESEKDVMQHACFVVRNMFKVVCNKELSITQLNLLSRDNTTNICPFDFSHLHPLGLDFVFATHELVKTLATKDECEKICYDVFLTQTQCILLNKFNNYLKTRNPSPHSDTFRFPPAPPIADTPPHKTVETAAAQPAKKEHSLPKNEAKNTTAKARTEAVISQTTSAKSNSSETSKKEKKVGKPVVTTTAKEEKQSTEGAEAPPVDAKLPEVEDDKTVSKSNDKLPEGEFSNEEDFPRGEDSLLESGILSQGPEPQKMQSLEEKGSSYLKEKNNYVGELSQAEDSHFFFYFIMMCSVVVIGYLAFHNKNKILAYALEGSSGRRNRRRPNPARYRRLETNLEEVISSNTTNATSSTVVY